MPDLHQHQCCRNQKSDPNPETVEKSVEKEYTSSSNDDSACRLVPPSISDKVTFSTSQTPSLGEKINWVEIDLSKKEPFKDVIHETGFSKTALSQGDPEEGTYIPEGVYGRLRCPQCEEFILLFRDTHKKKCFYDIRKKEFTYNEVFHCCDLEIRVQKSVFDLFLYNNFDNFVDRHEPFAPKSDKEREELRCVNFSIPKETKKDIRLCVGRDNRQGYSVVWKISCQKRFDAIEKSQNSNFLFFLFCIATFSFFVSILYSKIIYNSHSIAVSRMDLDNYMVSTLKLLSEFDMKQSKLGVSSERFDNVLKEIETLPEKFTGIEREVNIMGPFLIGTLVLAIISILASSYLVCR
jgi:hypothetical protein